MKQGTHFELNINGSQISYFQGDKGTVYFKWDNTASPVRISKKEYEEAKMKFELIKINKKE